MISIQELTVGESLPAIDLKPVSRIDLIKYAGASGDFNPIHTIDEEAKKAGLPGIIAHGMWTMGNLSQLFTPYIHAGFIQKYSVRFGNMVFLGDIITLKAELKKKQKQMLTFDVTAETQDGKNASAGEICFSLYETI